MSTALSFDVPPPATLLESMQRRIDLIEQCANEADKSDFARKWLAVLERCAAWFGTLPFSPDLYREAGGALRCTVETAFYAMRLAGGQKFATNLPSEQRRRIEPQYNHAVFLAAVCSGLDEPYRHFQIVREPDRVNWSPSAHGALGAWLGGASYQIHRRATPLALERMRTGMLAQMVIGQELLVGLDAEVQAELFGAINPNMQPLAAESLTHKVVRQAIVVAGDFDRKAQRGMFVPVASPVPAASHVAAQVAVVAPPAPSAVPAAPAAAPSPATPAAGNPAIPDASAAPTASAASVSPATPATATGPANPGVPSAPAAPVAPVGAGPLNIAVSAPVQPALAQSGGPISLQELLASHDASHAAPSSVDPSVLSMRASPDREASAPAAFDEILAGAPNMIREFFRALREDVACGQAKVTWNDKGLVLPKRLIGNYGLASETLVENLRKRSLLIGNGQGEVTLAPRAGELILERGA